MPFLENWKTSVGFTILGLVAGLISYSSAATDPVLKIGNSSFNFFIVLSMASITFIVLSIIYAAVIFPSLFSYKPLFKSSKVISFANGFFGGLIFGLIWNSNLTKRYKGISYKVFIVTNIVGIALILIGNYVAPISRFGFFSII